MNALPGALGQGRRWLFEGRGKRLESSASDDSATGGVFYGRPSRFVAGSFELWPLKVTKPKTCFCA